MWFFRNESDHHEIMERYISMLEEILHVLNTKTYHHCSANDGMVS